MKTRKLERRILKDALEAKNEVSNLTAAFVLLGVTGTLHLAYGSWIIVRDWGAASLELDVFKLLVQTCLLGGLAISLYFERFRRAAQRVIRQTIPTAPMARV